MMKDNGQWTLFEIRGLLLSKKYLILSAMLICMLAAGLYSFFAPKRYETFAILDLPKIRGEVLDSNNKISQVINSDGFLTPLIKSMKMNVSLKKMRRWVHANFDPQSPDTIQVQFILPQPELAKKITDAIVTNLRHLKKESYQWRMEIFRKQYDINVISEKNLYKDIGRIREVLESLRKDANHNAAMLSMLESRLNSAEAQRMFISKELRDMDLKVLSEEYTHEMRILSGPANPTEPTDANIKRNLIAAAFLGFVLGCILVLFAASFEKGKRAFEKEQASLHSI
jgi:uncharacterized protein involved in exopolysaccharide biosynthesis